MSESTQASPTPFQAWWTVSILFLAGTLANIDRTILSLLVGPLRRDLLLTDTQIGLLSGLAFGVVYAGAAIPIARLADTGSRRGLLSIGIAAWSLATALCGAAHHFVHLFIARMGVGVGEAVLTPSGFSLISDLFPKERRGFPLALFGASNAWGIGLALIVGGMLVQWVDHFGTVETWIGPLRSWQFVFVAIGLPGVIVALLALTMAEPRRRTAEKPPELAPGELLKFLKLNFMPLSLIFVAFAFGGMISNGSSSWSPAFFMRLYSMAPGTIGPILGVCVLLIAPVGGLCGGWLLNHLTRKGHTDAPLRLGLVAMFLFTVTHVLWPLMPNWWLCLAVYISGYVFGAIQYIAGAAAAQLVAPPRLRARVTAIYFLCVTIIAIGGGPAIVGLFTDYLFHDIYDVGWSIVVTGAIFGPIMMSFVALARKRYIRAVERTEALALR